jgi:glycosyltransferase involved in cell wall biosynthesis
MDNVEIIDSLDWSNPSEAVEEIKKFSIGIMPLTNSKWDQVKYFKVLEYMACGVPVVASPGKTAQAIIKESNCGLVASNTEDWIEALTLLLENPDLRDKMGKSGRAAIENDFAIKATAELLLNYIDVYRHSTPSFLNAAK